VGEPAAVAEPSLDEPAAVAEPSLEEPAGVAEPSVDEPAAVETGTGPAQLPVPSYDELSVASLRARLRNLDPAQLRELLAYERANAARPAVVSMFERRIAKLEGGED
jgi:hypothetical protein